MYKIIYNNQIIDVVDKIRYIKYIPQLKKSILIDERQANGIISSDDKVIYHLKNTKYNFPDEKKTVQVVKIDEEEYIKLTTQIQENKDLEKRVEELELLINKILEGR